MRLLPTALGAKGALFFAAVLLLFFATPYSNLFFLLTAFLAVLGGIGVAGCWRNLRRVGTTLVRVDAAPAGCPHEIELRLDLPKQARAYGVAAWIELAHARLPVAEAMLAVDGTLLRGNLGPQARGVHRIVAVRLRSRYPIGICSIELRLPVADAEVVAYPAPASFAGGRDADDPRADATVRAIAANDETVTGLREWRDGDALRDIHWRATARRGAPIVKERERDAGDGLEIVVDRRTDPAALEQALAVATALVLESTARQQPLRLRSQGFDAAHAIDRPARRAMLRWLAGATTLPTDAPPPPPCAPTSIRLPAPPRGGQP